MEFDIRTLVFIGSQVAFVATVVNSNRQHVQALRESNKELKDWLKELQDKLNDIRVKVGV